MANKTSLDKYNLAIYLSLVKYEALVISSPLSFMAIEMGAATMSLKNLRLFKQIRLVHVPTLIVTEKARFFYLFIY